VKRIADQTLYEILDVPADAGADVISQACERARALYGPGSLATYTLMSPEEAALLTSRIDEAKATLLDAGARARYDAALAQGREGARAVSGGNGASGAASYASLAPVILPAAPQPPPAAPEAPAARPSGPPPGATPQPPPSVENADATARPAALLAAAAAAASERPILLEREVKPAPEPEREAARGPSAPPAEAPAPPPAPAVPAPPVVPVVPEGAPWTGEVLRQLREARGLSVQQIAERTKVTRYHIENIEAERFGQLPAPVYLRGILLALARELRLDGQKVARSYLERMGSAAQKR
jgi:hypothetical protein